MTTYRRALLTAAVSAAVALTFMGARHRAVTAPVAPLPVAGPTFDNEVVRVFQAHCQSCHHPGDIAPFSMMSYGETRSWAQDIKLMVLTHQMPPWKPTPSCGDFADQDSRTLTQAEIDTIVKWVNNGAPEGNASDLPKPLDFSSGWAIGEPDLVAQVPHAFTPPADRDEYRCFSIPANTTEDKYVSAIDIHPGDRKSVHHVIAFLDTTGDSARLDTDGSGYQCFGGPGFSFGSLTSSTLGGWAPGFRPAPLPEGVSMLLPANSRIVLQVHYHPHDANPLPDQTSIGVYYSKTKPSKLLTILPVINQNFTIPPNDPNYKVTASLPVGLLGPVHLWLIAPHMHLLGRTMNVEAALPDGSKKCLVNIGDWDFNWQGMYRYTDPIALPRNTVVNLTATFDNSTDNFRNPNSPPRPVSWGEATTDEMCIAFVGVTLDSQNLQ